MADLSGIARLAKRAQETINVYRNILTDPGILGRFFETQLYRATIEDQLPTSPLLMLNPSHGQFKAAICPRADVYKCMYYGTVRQLPCVLQQHLQPCLSL